MMYRGTKILTVLGATFMLPLFVSVLSPQQSLLTSVAVAEEKEEQPKYKDFKTRQRQSVGTKCAKALERVQVILEEEQNFPESLRMLSNIESSSKTCKSDYEKTQIWKFKGYVYYSLDDFPSAINAYRQVINSIGVPEDLRLDTRYTLAQLYTAEEQYAEAARELEIWMHESTIIGNDSRALLAQIYYQLGRKDDSLLMISAAIDDAESKGILPKERWWSLQRVLYYEKDNYQAVTTILEKLVEHYPKWSYWKQLGSMYGEQERDMDRLVTADIVYLNNQYDKESQLMGLAYMYLGADVPYRAALVIEQGIRDNIIETNAKNLELLGTSWYQSKDLERALKSLEQASKYSDTGDLQSRIAGIYLDLGRDKEAYLASAKADKKSGLKRSDLNYLVMGNALVNLHCYKDATSAFRKALEVAKTESDKRYPKQWIKFADSEGTRLGKLRDLGAEVPGCGK
jgi:tetratricopeptide (TPR) repeat protein